MTPQDPEEYYKHHENLGQDGTNRVWCPACGDVTDRHTYMDMECVKMMENAFNTKYVDENEDPFLTKGDMDVMGKFLIASSVFFLVLVASVLFLLYNG
jgi:hypothetical protein